jgi:hypothetical protein
MLLVEAPDFQSGEQGFQPLQKRCPTSNAL